MSRIDYYYTLYTLYLFNEKKGYECPEERDYYPYWHPNGGWNDIAILTSQPSVCSRVNSDNSNDGKNLCVENYKGTTKQKGVSRWNNKLECEKANGNFSFNFRGPSRIDSYTRKS